VRLVRKVEKVKTMTRHRLLGILVAAVVLIGLGVGLANAAPWRQANPLTGDATVWSKIDPLVLKELNERGTTTFLVHLHPRANLVQSRRAYGGERLTSDQVRAQQVAQRRSVMQALQATADSSQRQIRAYLDQQQATGHVAAYRSYWIFNGLAVTGDRDTLMDLAARPEVETIRANHTRHILERGSRGAGGQGNRGEFSPAPLLPRSPAAVGWNIARIGADRVWSELQITGTGSVVGSLDTGVDWTHPALRHQYRGVNGDLVDHNYNWFDATGKFPDAPGDDEGHGTHTTGTAVGGDGSANQIGVAPGARWIAFKAFDSSGGATDADLHTGLQWMIAPTDLAGRNPDPGKAPDVVNNSWGSSIGADPSFWDDIQALRAAGIVPVFSAGNDGEVGLGSIGIPASYPQSFAVGATDSEDAIADFSSQGPSFWDEIKPDVSAPGVNIRSSTPDGQYRLSSGTSMAAPHVSGLVALLKAADPGLQVADLEQFIRYTALDLGTPGPDNIFGAGRIDAYQAVRWALSAGKLEGLVKDNQTGIPIPRATVNGLYRGVQANNFRTETDSSGQYSINVPAGTYELTAQAFGYLPATVTAINVITGFRTLRDLALTPAPTGVLRGQVLSDAGDAPLSATMTIEGAPAPYPTHASGQFNLTLPAGTHRLHIHATGHRALTTTVTITAGAVLQQDFRLHRAPKILVVDGDAWRTAVHLNYYRWPLDALGLPYDTRLITDTHMIPTGAELSAYDLVIWGQYYSSPGYIDRNRGDTATVDALTGYVRNGGRLLITGQDIGYWDSAEGSSDNQLARDFFARVLHARYVADRAADSLHLTGIPGDLLAGIHLTLEDVYGRKRGDALAPDVILPIDAQGTPILVYGVSGSEIAGLRVTEGQGRVVYLAFGIEGAGPRPEVVRTFAQIIAWLSMPSFTLSADPPGVKPSGTVTFTLRMANPGMTTAPGLTLTNPLPPALNLVPGSLTGGANYDAATRSVHWTGDLLPQQEHSLRYQATLTARLAGGTPITNTATLIDSQGQATVANAVVTVVAANLSAAHKSVDRTQAGPGDVLTYTISVLNSTEVPAVDARIIDPIPAGTSYVPGSVTGGATYNAAANQIEWTGTVPGLVAGGQAYTYTLSTQPGGPVFDWLPITSTGTLITDLGDDTNAGPFPIGFEFPFYGQSFNTFRVCSNGWISFTSNKTLYSDRSLPDPTAPENLIAAFWTDLDFLQGGSAYYWTNHTDTLVVAFIEVARHGRSDRFTFQMILRVDGTITLQYLSMNGDVTQSTIGIQNADGTQGLTIARREAFVQDRLAVRIAPVTAVPWPRITFRAHIDPQITDNTAIQNVAHILDAQGIVYTRTATTLVQPADLTGSTKAATPGLVGPGDVVTYTIRLRNNGPARAPRVQVVDPIPRGVSYVAGSATGGATFDATTNRILWDGLVPSGSEMSFDFRVRTQSDLADGTTITNTATFDDRSHAPFTRQAVIQVTRPNLSQSAKSVDRSAAISGDILTYAIDLVNSTEVTAHGVTLSDPIPTGLRYLEGSATGGATYDPAANTVRWHGDVGPGRGYAWLTSDQPGGPAFNWFDATTNGVRIEGLRDDSNVGPFPIGFSFPFYDQTFESFRVCSNGWLSFTSTDTDYQNRFLPDPQAPRNLIAIFWDDLNLVNNGTVYYWTNQRDTLVVSWIGVPRHNTSFQYTFQAILKADGSITFQYLTMPGTRLNEATIGVQNQTGTEGLTIVYNQPLVHDNLAIRLVPRQPKRLSFRAIVEPGVPSNTVITNTATLDHRLGETINRTVATRINVVDLTTSQFSVSRTQAEPGARLEYRLELANTGLISAAVQANIPIPAHTRYLEGSATGGVTYDASANAIHWQGTILAGASRQFTFAVQVDDLVPDSTVVDAIATIQVCTKQGECDGVHPAFTRTARTTIFAPDLRSSTKTASSALADPGDIITYTLDIRNTGNLETTAELTDRLAANVEFIAGSAWAGSGNPVIYDAATHEVRWRGLMPPRSLAQVRFGVRVTHAATIVNTARIEDRFGTVVEVTATTQARAVTAVIRAGRSMTGYVRSNNTPGNYLGDANLYTGADERRTPPAIFHGVTQFDLSPIPRGARILSAELELRGRDGLYLSPAAGGTWQVQLLGSTVDQDWRGLGYWHIHHAPVVTTLTPGLHDDDLAEGRTNVLTFDATALRALEDRLKTTGRASFRLDGSAARRRVRHIFAWDATAPPVLRITYQP